MIWIAALLILAALALAIVALTGPNLTTDFHRMLAIETASDQARPHPTLREADIALLPAPVQRYIRRSGAIGQPRPASILVTYDAQMFSKPGAEAMSGVALQYDRFDPPKRLFYLPTRMAGLPVKVLHDYDGTEATMKVRLAGLYNIVDAGGTDLSRIETVTLLNDLCLFAPSWMSDPRLDWTSSDDHRATVTFRNGTHAVSATLYFNAADELVNFVSQDRGETAGDGSITRVPWSTPLRSYRDFSGLNVAGYGEAVWIRPEGDFTYGKFTVTDLRLN